MQPPTGLGPPRAAAVLLAAGRSTRMTGARLAGAAREAAAAGRALRKPLLELHGRTILEHACAAFDRARTIDAVVIVAHSDDRELLEALRARSEVMRKVTRIVVGGAERTDSVRAGVAELPVGTRFVAVHDAARALVTAELVDACVRCAAEAGTALAALAVRDTIKRSPDGRSVTETLDRAQLWAAQTPQVFPAARFSELLARAAAEGFCATDDAALWERYVGPVALVEGSETNLKITTPEDLELGAAILAQREAAEVSAPAEEPSP